VTFARADGSSLASLIGLTTGQAVTFAGLLAGGALRGTTFGYVRTYLSPVELVALGIASLSDGLVDVASLSHAAIWKAVANDLVMDSAELSDESLWLAQLADLTPEYATVEDEPL
jgi:hypothetical protein